MQTFWTLGIVISLMSTALLMLAVLGLARELGILLVRVGPTRALPTHEGIDIGARVGPFVVYDLDGKERTISPSKSMMNLLLFTSPTCPICEGLLSPVRSFAASYAGLLNVTILSNAEPNDIDRQWSERLGAAGIVLASAPQIHQQMGVLGTPFAMLLDADNVVTARGAVNSMEHLESLISMRIFTDHRQKDGGWPVDAGDGVAIRGGTL